MINKLFNFDFWYQFNISKLLRYLQTSYLAVVSGS